MIEIIATAIASLLLASAMPSGKPESGESFCCTSCRHGDGIWMCSGCSAGTACAGDVFSCAGSYTESESCTVSAAANSCCE